MLNAQLLSDLGINLRGKSGGIIKTTCPKCNGKTPDLSVDIDSGLYKCHKPSCDFRGKVFIKEEKKPYVKPIFRDITNLGEKVVHWFKDRGISQQTLLKMKIGAGLEWMPQTQKNENTIQFNYFRNGELINVKYRDGAKNFKLSKDAELIFYNLDAIKDATECIIVEGEMDALSWIEAGYLNVVSVPNGATKGSNKLEYLDNCWEYFEHLEKIYLATDQDDAGHNLKMELARRLDPDKCLTVDFKDCKDSNDYLKKYGILELLEVVKNAKEFPLDGVVNAYDIQDEINHLYDMGLNAGAQIGDEYFDEHLSFELGNKTIITGIPGHGKSEFLDYIMVKLAIKYGWKFGIFSPENMPLEIHVSKFAEKIIGKSFSGKYKMNPMEKDAAIEFVNEHFKFICPNDDFSLEGILKITKGMILRYGIKSFVIDPWNRLDDEPPIGSTETRYISKQLDMISQFQIKYMVHPFLVVHPTKMKKDKAGNYEVPNLYDLMGSSNFFNKTENGISVYKSWSKEDNKYVSEIHIQKVKFKHLGKPGMCRYKWNFISGRYMHDASFGWDNTNWLDKGQQVELTFFEDQLPTLPKNENLGFAADFKAKVETTTIDGVTYEMMPPPTETLF